MTSPLAHLTLIGERINPGFASSKALIDRHDLNGLQALAVSQVQKGAHYLTINIGAQAAHHPPFLTDLIRAVQDVVDVPLAFDYPDRSVQKVCLQAYDPTKARGRKPILNSVSELRTDMLDLARIHPVRMVLMASERLEDGREEPNRTAEHIVATSRRLVSRILQGNYGLTPDDLLVDVSLCPIASDTEGLVKHALTAIQQIGSDPALRGVHPMVGLSNLGILLPKHAIDGSPLHVKLESAFLTLAMPAGLDTILGTPGRDYRILPEDDVVLRTFKEIITLDGFEGLRKLQELYRMR